MHRIALIAAVTALSATPAFAQSFEGNWGCRDTTSAKAGILTIYGSVYGFASTTMGDAASGTGTITGYEDGVAFNDGGLMTARNIVAGRVIADPTYVAAIQLETADAIVMLCTPR
jgi:energy-converting hydrogenase Eha subunit B